MPRLQRQLTLPGLILIAVGSCIGAGIFATPSNVVDILGRPSWVLATWATGGLIALTGALTFAELGGLFPGAGGVYVFLREAYGRAVGFLYGWVTLLVINTGALAALSLIFSGYLGYLIPLSETGELVVAILAIILLTGINIIGVGVSEKLTGGLTLLKLAAIVFIIGVGLLFGQEQLNSPEALQLPGDQDERLWPLLFISALVGVLFSFGGWHHASYLAGETRNPQRTVPLAMMYGALIVTVTYLLLNLAYFYLLPLGEFMQSTAVAGDALERVLPYGGTLASVIIAVSVFGTISIYTMSAPRIYFAMAQDGLFFKKLAEIHPRFQTPANAMMLQAAWAVLLLLFWKTFQQVIGFVTFMDIAFMCLAAAAVFLFRKKRPELPRPYRTIGYPVVPLIFCTITGSFVVGSLFTQPMESLVGLGLLGIGMVVYYWRFRS